jgi:hypothetical protein
MAVPRVSRVLGARDSSMHSVQKLPGEEISTVGAAHGQACVFSRTGGRFCFLPRLGSGSPARLVVATRFKRATGGPIAVRQQHRFPPSRGGGLVPQ